tara:strand:+ start:7887 stop:8420 length:534 start_codon:yes stop_codon:yes gene_type:complete
MKLFGKFNEYTINDICLYGTPSHIIKDLMTKSGTEIRVKEYKPKTFKKTRTREKDKRDSLDTITEEIEVKQDKAQRHQVIAIQDLGFAKISVYSIPLGYKEIEKLGLEPIETAVRKEKLALSLEKFTDTSPEERGATIKTIPSQKMLDLKRDRFYTKPLLNNEKYRLDLLTPHSSKL